MNASSKAIASTWQSVSDYLDNQDSDLSDGESTPRASGTSRVSTCSSIDIHEFKPLPATPSTFKNTIKRLGQKMAPSKAADTRAVPLLASASEAKPRRGLRRSISRWKILNNSQSDWEGHSNTDATRKVSRMKETKISGSTPKGETLGSNALPPKAVLDERKRKAELAYSQQFGTMRKKSRHSDARDDQTARPVVFKNLSQSTIRQWDYRRPSDTPISLSTSRSMGPDDQTLSKDDLNTRTSAASAARNQQTVLRNHIRSHSHDSALCPESTRDFAKKPSRQELEKENQRLRLMLREGRQKITSYGHQRSSHETDHSGTISSDNPVATMNGSSSVSNHATQRPLVALSSTVKKPAGTAQIAELPRVTATTKYTVCSPDRRSHSSVTTHVQNISRLVSSSPQNKPLSVVTGNEQRPSEIATMERRASVVNSSRQAGLPRPLSMVLEDIENGDNEGDQCGKTSTGLTCNSRREQESRALEASMHYKSTKGAQQWIWPEDVF